MGNILFQNRQSGDTGGKNSILNMLGQVRSMGPSGTVFNQMYQNNPEFRQFADSMRGKTPDQAFRENGLDFNRFKNMRW